jgi:hypothetical protein
MVSAERTDPREEFLALLCADEDLLRAEFDAIVAANWDRPTPPRPTPPRRPFRWWPRQPPSRTTSAGSVDRRCGFVWRRGRSPPHGAAVHTGLGKESGKDGDRLTFKDNKGFAARPLATVTTTIAGSTPKPVNATTAL